MLIIVLGCCVCRGTRLVRLWCLLREQPPTVKMKFDAGVPLGVGDYEGQVVDEKPDGQVRYFAIYFVEMSVLLKKRPSQIPIRYWGGVPTDGCLGSDGCKGKR